MKKRLVYLFNLLLLSVYSFAQDTLTGISEDPASKGTGMDGDPGSKGTIPGEGSGDEPINWLLYGGIALIVLVVIYFVMKSRKEK